MHARKSGFTLIELMIFVAMFSIIITILMQIYSAIVSKQIEVQQFSSVDTDRIYLLARLGYDIGRATSITTPSGIGITSSMLGLVIDGTNYTYSVSQNRMLLTRGSSTEYVNSFRSSITHPLFTRLGNTNGKNAVGVGFTVSSTLIDQTPETHQASTTFSIR